MALEWLAGILGDAHTPEIEQAIEQEIGRGFVARKAFNELNAKYKTTSEQVAELEKVKTERDTSQAQLIEAQKKISTQSRDFAIDRELLQAGAVNVKAVRALLDDTKLSIDDSGKLTGLKEQVESLRKSDPWTFSKAAAGATTQTQLPLGGSPDNGTGAAKPTGDLNQQMNNLIRGKRSE